MPSIFLCRPGTTLRLVDLLHQRVIEDVVDQRRLARTRHAGDGDEAAEREPHVDVAEVVGPRAAHADPIVAGRAPALRHRDAAPAGEVLAGDRLLVLEQARDRARVDDLAAVLAGARADVDDVIGDADRLFVVLDHEHRVAEIAQAHQRVDQALVVALMQADRRLVEHVEHTDETAADLRRQSGCAALRRRRACPRCATARGSRDRRRAGNPSRALISLSTCSAMMRSRSLSSMRVEHLGGLADRHRTDVGDVVVADGDRATTAA